MMPPVTFLDGRVTRAVLIYGLCDGATGERRYTGKTTSTLARRLTEHLTASKRSSLPVGRWLRKQLADGKRPTIELLEVVPAGGDWAARESAWISTIPVARRLNLTIGGEGLHGYKFAGTPHATKIAATLRTGRYFNCEVCDSRLWRKQCEIAKGDCRFCSRKCYAVWQAGKPKQVPEETTRRGVAAAAAKRRGQTFCKRGHPLSGDNVYLTTLGYRICKACRKIHKARYRGGAHA